MCINDCLSTIVFILPLHLDYTKVIILILWWRNFQLEYWRTFQLVSTITVNSGYRCPELNAAVKGSKTSQHMKGEAADIDTGDRQQNKLLFEYIRKNLPYDQLIDESNFAWVHVSYRADGDNRMQVLKL